MSTSGVTGFALEILDVIEEAYSRAKVNKQKLTGDHLDEGRRSINLALQSWGNVQERPWATSLETFFTQAGEAEECLPDDTIDVLEATHKRNNYEIPMTRLSRDDYQALPDKTIPGRSDRFYVHRDRDAITMYLYETPENSTDEISYWRIRELETATNLEDSPDVMRRWYDALCAETASRVYQKLPADQSNLEWQLYLDRQAEKAFDLALEEDRDRAPLQTVPYNYMTGV